MTIKQSKRYNIYLGAIILLLIVIGCAPLPIEQTPTTETVFLNTNPDLEYGGCELVTFDAGAWGREVIRQCYPEGYTLHHVSNNNPIRVNFNGGYVINPRNNSGQIGFQLPPMTLTPGKHLVIAYGHTDLEGHLPDYDLVASYAIEGVDGVVMMGRSQNIRYHGNYSAMFTLDAPQLGVYNVAVYLDIVYPSLTASSTMTFEKITVEVAPD